ncbi:MAG TPA: hypothetical protein DEQ88_01430 [Clostridiales bacterium]|nr:hypothetical protein [Clostridiales bacterium]
MLKFITYIIAVILQYFNRFSKNFRLFLKLSHFAEKVQPTISRAELSKKLFRTKKTAAKLQAVLPIN